MKASKNINPNDLMSVSAYAKLAGKTTQRIYQLIDAKKLNTMILGGKIFIIK